MKAEIKPFATPQAGDCMTNFTITDHELFHPLKIDLTFMLPKKLIKKSN